MMMIVVELLLLLMAAGEYLINIGCNEIGCCCAAMLAAWRCAGDGGNTARLNCSGGGRAGGAVGGRAIGVIVAAD